MRYALVIGVLLLAGCGSGNSKSGNGAPAQQVSTQKAATAAKQEFMSNCAECHTLAAANASGTDAPNLDQMKPNFQRVQQAMLQGPGPMPSFKDRLTPLELKAIANYVATSAGAR